jgi:Ca2+-binding RTX toxin-like protein
MVFGAIVPVVDVAYAGGVLTPNTQPTCKTLAISPNAPFDVIDHPYVTVEDADMDTDETADGKGNTDPDADIYKKYAEDFDNTWVTPDGDKQFERWDKDSDGIDSTDGWIVEGTKGADIIFGSDKDDLIKAGKGDDHVCAGDGDDLVKLGSGDDGAKGALGNDIILGGHGNDVLQGGGDHDIIQGRQDKDVLLGRDGNDSLDGGQDDDYIHGGLETIADTCNGGRGTNSIFFCEL